MRYPCRVFQGMCLVGLTFAGGWTSPPSTAPTERPLAALLSGTYRGLVVDDDETVPCVTRFTTADGAVVSGTYTVREGRDAYEGKLSDFALLDPATRTCRFTWRDRNGTGVLIVRVSEDGSRFEGSWGVDGNIDSLIWTGERQPPATRRSTRR